MYVLDIIQLVFLKGGYASKGSLWSDRFKRLITVRLAYILQIVPQRSKIIQLFSKSSILVNLLNETEV